MLSSKQKKYIGNLAGIVGLVIVAFYISGLYRNILEIKDLKENGNSQTTN